MSGRERPIIFSAPMIRALLDGRKTQTRRVLADANVYEDIASEAAEDFELRGWIGFSRADALCAARVTWRPGDQIWVKEACAILAEPHADFSGNVAFRADHDAPIRWRSPIHMPRWASRLTLTVTDVRVHRLHDISDDDALAEGVDPRCQPDPARPDLIWVGSPLVCKAPKLAYRDLWNSLHGPDAWDANPWVVAISFKPVPTPTTAAHGAEA